MSWSVKKLKEIDIAAVLEEMAPQTERYHGYRAEVGISEVSLIAQYARRPVGPKRLAEELERLNWPADQALEFARIVSRVCELAWTRNRRPR